MGESRLGFEGGVLSVYGHETIRDLKAAHEFDKASVGGHLGDRAVHFLSLSDERVEEVKQMLKKPGVREAIASLLAREDKEELAETESLRAERTVREAVGYVVQTKAWVESLTAEQINAFPQLKQALADLAQTLQRKNVK